MEQVNAVDSKANANPSKNFFIAMLTRDIDLADCILDLLDNSVDGIGDAARRAGLELAAEKPYDGHVVKITYDGDHFSISDKSGGIPLEIAKDYAFRFGRPDDAPAPIDGTIGLYGIGMKRAIFKIGNTVKLQSSTGSESFNLNLDVNDWRRDPQVHVDGSEERVEWTFPLSEIVTSNTQVEMGTSICITDLNPGVSRQFQNPAFSEKLRRVVSRDYAFILEKGLEVEINGQKIGAIIPSLRQSNDFVPYQYFEEIDGVRIEILAGLSDPPPDDTSATARNPDSGIYGWYVVCNDRVVVSADKGHETGWGIRPVPNWHPQYIGFMGVVRFYSGEPEKLPWKTTKRDVESSNIFYQRALVKMMAATKKLTDYTNSRKSEVKKLKRLERSAQSLPVARVTENRQMSFPAIAKSKIVTIQYTREESAVTAVAEALGILGTSPTEVGIRTFEYFYQREIAK